MSASPIERRIFVVGVPRSGTTLVQSMLASHSKLSSFTESHFFSRHFAPLPLAGQAVLRRDPTARLRQFLQENGVATVAGREALEDLLQGPLSRLAAPVRSRRIARRFLAVLDEIARQRGKTGWVEKTPAHLRYIRFIEGLEEAPPTHFVHVIRDGLEVASSLFVASCDWERAYDLDTCVARWNEEVELSLERVDSWRDHFVFYEDLTTDPATTMKRLLEELGLEWQADVVKSYGDAAAALVTPEESWKRGVGREVRRSATSAEALTDAERNRAQSTLRQELYRRLRAAAGRDSSLDGLS